MTRRSATAGIVLTAIAAGALLSVAPAQAATSNVGWWQQGDLVCAPWGNGVNVVPVIITNASSVPRTGSFTVPTPIVDAVQVSSNINAINCNNGSARYGYSTDFTVAPGQTTVMWVGLGTTGAQTGWGSHNIGFGGKPSGTPGASWYDMGLTLDNAVSAWNGGNTFNNIVFGPYADNTYSVVVNGTIRLPSLYKFATQALAATAKTFISTYLPDLLVQASMIYISQFQRNFGPAANDPNMGPTYELQYQNLLKSAFVEEARKKFEASAWSSMSPSVAATPTR